MGRNAAAALASLMLVAGCGGGDDEPAGTQSSGTSDAATVVEGAPYDITVGEFIAELQPDKQDILAAFVAESAACKGVTVDPGFVLLVSAQAIDAGPDAPLAGLVEEQC